MYICIYIYVHTYKCTYLYIYIYICNLVRRRNSSSRRFSLVCSSAKNKPACWDSVALCCIVLECVLVCGSVLQLVAWYDSWQRVAACCVIWLTWYDSSSYSYVTWPINTLICDIAHAHTHMWHNTLLFRASILGWPPMVHSQKKIPHESTLRGTDRPHSHRGAKQKFHL